MRKAISFYIVAVALSLCILAGIAAAQGSEGDTSISYDDATGLVTAYAETTNDLDSDYATEVPTTVKDQNGVTVASGNDYELYDGSSVSLQFTATPGSTYTATTLHCFRLQSWGQDEVFPYDQFYYDDWNMSSFLGENINEPWDYWFASPGYQEVHRPSNYFCVGKTYDTVSVPSVQKIQYKTPGTSTYVDAIGTQYVLKGTTVDFKAIPNPNTATFPSGNPVWSGSSGATGTGATKSVTFNTVSSSTSDYKTIIATAAGSPVTVNVVVYELTGTITPIDDQNFSGHSSTRLGLLEKANLSSTTSPSISASSAGGLRWSVGSDQGTVTNETGNTGGAEYQAPYSAQTADFVITVVAGPSKDLTRTYSRAIVAPSAGTVVRNSSHDLIHCNGTSSAGFYGSLRIQPADVSFSRLYFREGGGTFHADGLYVGEDGLSHLTWSVADLLSDCNSSTGCLASDADLIFTGRYNAPYGTGGTLFVDIDWQYAQTESGTSAVTFATIRHNQSADSSGTATISKGASGNFSRAVADPTSEDGCTASN